MHVKEAGSERPKSLSIQARRERHRARTNKQRFCYGIGNGRKSLPSGGNGRATNELMGNPEGMLIISQKQLVKP